MLTHTDILKVSMQNNLSIIIIFFVLFIFNEFLFSYIDNKLYANDYDTYTNTDNDTKILYSKAESTNIGYYNKNKDLYDSKVLTKIKYKKPGYKMPHPDYDSNKGIGIALGNIIMGHGGVSGPPSYEKLAFYEVFINSNNKQFLISIFPGIFYQFVSNFKKGYVSIGPGLMADRSSIGLGASAGFGLSVYCFGNLCLHMNYRHALGMGTSFTRFKFRFLSNSSIRIGLYFEI